ncbi:unnamed protein product [Rotaria magnacalcarata]|uniref:RING-type domain-containing protein n=2 Tax=Rotaria magnacalcarata TaxID=392030 RepID=A0A819BUG1_9BILA|nr:unnamed protein product [Rotaria magnacalcarata]CAF1610716.1 unnamed protein product [Rotaria magnacalcarata]CAF2135391.1 unnamed protein product [Rotaria magnacalcarata]CAF2157144.1 unnamed protein product [Rotaria magnacalcarata]CAF2219419.1 unnamed protein product [Rotaria magnacalcarata]
MSQSLTYSQRNTKWQKKSLITYDCSICLTPNTHQLLELPCGHNLCLSCLYMICAHSILACPFCRCRLSTWLRRNPDYSKLIIKRQSNTEIPKKKTNKRKLKKKLTLDDNDNISDDWLFAKSIHHDEIEEFRYSYTRITRSMAKKMET